MRPGAYEPVAEVVHVGERMHVRCNVNCSPGCAKLDERIGAKSRESEESTRLQHTRNRSEGRIEVLAPGEHQVAEDEIHARVIEWQGLGFRAKSFDASFLVEPAGLAQHPG